MKPDFLTTPNVWLRASRTYVSPAEYGEAITKHECKRGASRFLALAACAVAIVSFAYLVMSSVTQ